MHQSERTAPSAYPHMQRHQIWYEALDKLLAYPPEPYDICLDYLPSEYDWFKADAHTFSAEGLLGIFSCGGLSFVSIDEFANARDQILGYDPAPYHLPTDFRIDHVWRRYLTARLDEQYPEASSWNKPPRRIHTDTYRNRLQKPMGQAPVAPYQV